MACPFAMLLLFAKLHWKATTGKVKRNSIKINSQQLLKETTYSSSGVSMKYLSQLGTRHCHFIYNNEMGNRERLHTNLNWSQRHSRHVAKNTLEQYVHMEEHTRTYMQSMYKIEMCR